MLDNLICGDNIGIPVYDGCNFELQPIDFYCGKVRECITDIYPFLSSDDGSVVINNGISLNPTSVNNLITTTLVGSDLTIGNTTYNIDGLLDGWNFNIFNGVSSTNIRVGDTLTIVGLDGIEFLVPGPQGISVGLPMAPNSYFVPGWNGGVPGNPNDTSDYKPFNDILVLTWDDCLNKAYREVPQCCVQTLSFGEEASTIAISGGGHQDPQCLNYEGECIGSCKGECKCGGCGGSGGISIGVSIGQTYSLESINSDNQQLTLTGNDLCINRWEGDSLGNITVLPDSCVDLENVNEHTLDVQGNILSLLGSDGLVNNIINLENVNEHTIDLTGNILDILGSDGVINDTVDLSSVAEEILSIFDRILSIGKQSDPNPDCSSCKQKDIDLSYLNFTCSDIADCICNLKVDWQALGVSPNPANACAFSPDPLPGGPVTCAEWGTTSFGQWTTWSAQVYTRNTRVIHNGERYFAIKETLATDVPGTNPLVWALISDSLRPNDGWKLFFSQPRTIADTIGFLSGRLNAYVENPCGCCSASNGVTFAAGAGGSSSTGGSIQGSINLVAEQIANTKYRAKIWTEGNRTVWCKHNVSGPTGARWYVPYFDKGAGWRSQNTDTIDCNNRIGPHQTLLSFPGLSQTISLGTGYSNTPSANNPNPGSSGAFSQFGSLTITIPRDGMYEVMLNGNIEVDHNVHAYRYGAFRRNAITNQIDILLDTKYGGGTSVGSESVNDPLVPTTKQYQHGATKVMRLNKGDILFTMVKIDPRTYRPNLTNDGGGACLNPPGCTSIQQRDILTYLNNTLTNPYGLHTSGIASGPDVSWSPGALTYNYIGAPATNTVGRPASSLPNIAPLFYGAAGGTDGAENYGFTLVYPNHNPPNSFWKDDGVLTVLGQPGWYNSDGQGQFEGDNKEGGSTLSVHWVNSIQDDTERIVDYGSC